MLNDLKNAASPPPAEAAPKPRYSAEPETTLHRAFDYANQRKHEYATLEHLLLALIDDAHASAVMRACNGDPGVLREKLASYLDNELNRLVVDKGGNARPTAAFQRVTQHAARLAQELERPVVTGADALLAIFPETESRAARLLGEQGVSRERAATLSLTLFT
jgi:ATP-dependent Clp protease ATP-binding subunit ClpA